MILQTELGNLSTQTNSSLYNMKQRMEGLMDKWGRWVQANEHFWEETTFYTVSSKLADIITLINSEAIDGNFRHLRMQCDNHRLSNLFVTNTELTIALNKLQGELRKNDKELAIDASRLHLYHRLPLTDCIFGDTSVLISVKVPFVTMGKLWELYNLKPIPIAAGNRTMILDIPAVQIARSGLDSLAMRSTDSGDGGTCKDGLCMIPEDRSAMAENRVCLDTIFRKASVGEFRNKCRFKEIEGNPTRITKVSQYSYYLTHPDPDTNIECIDKGRKVVDPVPAAPEFGALKVTLKCKCSIVSKTRVLVGPVFPCTGMDERDRNAVERVVPASWTGLHQAILLPPDRDGRSHTITNFTAVKDLPWESDIKEIQPIPDLDSPLDMIPFIPPPPISAWMEGQFAASAFLLWVAIIAVTGFVIFLFYETTRLRRQVNALALASISFEMIGKAEGQRWPETDPNELPWRPRAPVVPTHLEAAIMIIFIIAILYFIPRTVRLLYRVCRWFYPRNRNVNVSYRPWTNRRDTAESRITTDSNLTQVMDESVFKPTTTVVPIDPPEPTSLSKKSALLGKTYKL